MLFVGWQPRETCLRWMRAATLTVCPSRYEGMSLAPLEAAALGVPMLATRVDGMGSELSPAARRLVRPDDADELSVALREMLADPDAAGGRRRGGGGVVPRPVRGRRSRATWRSTARSWPPGDRGARSGCGEDTRQPCDL